MQAGPARHLLGIRKSCEPAECLLSYLLCAKQGCWHHNLLDDTDIKTFRATEELLHQNSRTGFSNRFSGLLLRVLHPLKWREGVGRAAEVGSWLSGLTACACHGTCWVSTEGKLTGGNTASLLKRTHFKFKNGIHAYVFENS
jgi:hypothetical protein